MQTQPWRISLRQFMLMAAAFPPVVAVFAGVFGKLLAAISWIIAIAVVWYALTCGLLYAAVHAKNHFCRIWERFVHPTVNADPSASEY